MYSYRFVLFTIFLLSSIAVAAQTATKTFTTSPTDNSLLYAKCRCTIDDQAVLTNRNLDAFLQRLQTDSFAVETDRRAIPQKVLRQLNCLQFRGNPFIANPGEDYQRTDIIIKRASPLRQLIYLAKSQDILVMTYMKGGGWGGGKQIMFIQFDKHGIVDLWSGFGEGPLSSKADILESIRQRRGQEWGLNTNIVNF